MPAAPSVAQSAPMATTGSAPPAAGGDGTCDDVSAGLAAAGGWLRPRSMTTKATAAMATTASATAPDRSSLRRFDGGAGCCLACLGPDGPEGPDTTGASLVASESSGCAPGASTRPAN